MKDIKTRLSKERTLLAGTRTLLAYIRTSLVCISVAFAFIKLDKNDPIDWFTIVLFVLSGLFLVIGIAEYCWVRHNVHKLNDEQT